MLTAETTTTVAITVSFVSALDCMYCVMRPLMKLIISSTATAAAATTGGISDSRVFWASASRPLIHRSIAFSASC